MADPIEQQLLFSDVFQPDDLCLTGDLGELLSPDFIAEFLSDGDMAGVNKASTSGEVVSSFDRAASPEVTSTCAPPATNAAGLASSGSASEPMPTSLLMAWPANLVTTAVQQQPMQMVPQPVAVAAASRRRSSGPSSSCSSDSGADSQPHAGNPSATSSGDSPAATAATADGAAAKLTRMQAAAAKRKAPEVDWRAITDPAERRKQRRLAKNRVTAARSRERKKAAWGEMEETMAQLQGENAQLRAAMELMAQENARLQAALASRYSGAGTVCGAACVGGSATEPAVLVCLTIMHLVRLPSNCAAARAFLLLLSCLCAAALATTVAASFGLGSGFATLLAFGPSLVCMTDSYSWLEPPFFAVRARARRRHTSPAPHLGLPSGSSGTHKHACAAPESAGSSKHVAALLDFNRAGLGCEVGGVPAQQMGMSHVAAEAA